MEKYAKKTGEHTYDVGLGNDEAFYKSLGYKLTDVEQGYDNNWYDVGYAPQKPQDEITEEKLEVLDRQFNQDKALLIEQYATADMIDDDNLKSEIKAELIALQEQYDKDYEEIIGGAE